MAIAEGNTMFKLPVWVHTIEGAAFDYLELTPAQVEQMKRENYYMLYGTEPPEDNIVGAGDPVEVILAANKGVDE